MSDLQISSREHLEQILARVESTVKDQIAELRLDIKEMKAGFISRIEYDTKLTYIERELYRIERDAEQALSEHKKKIDEDRQRSLVIFGLVIAATELAAFVILTLLT